MKFAISMTALFLLFGTAASAYGHQEKGQEGHSQAAKPAAQHSAPAQQQHSQQARPAQQHAAAPPRAQQSRPTAQQHSQTAARSQQGHSTNQGRSQQSHASAQNRGGNGGGHGRIDNAHYNRSFGSGHSFHVNRGDYDRHRFAYGGYNFGFGAPWPVGWGYDDDVYVMYTDGGYYMYDRFHPGVRLSINIL